MHVAEAPRAQSAISVHLVQREGGYHTTFTYKGALAGLGWGSILEHLVKKTRRGGGRWQRQRFSYCSRRGSSD